MPHDHHRHQHHHGEASDPQGGSGALAGTGIVNLSWALAQAAAGAVIGSTALLSDSVHNLGDAVGLILAWIASSLATRRATDHRTWGWHRAEQLAGFANAGLVLAGASAVGIGAIWRLAHPVALEGLSVSYWALGGIAVNALSAWWIGAGHHNLNSRGAFLHLVSDALISGAVVAAGVAVHFTHQSWIDPLLALLVAGWLAKTSWKFFRETLDALLDAVPLNQNLSRIERDLADLDGVEAIHDLHVWPLGGDRAALTAHLVHREGSDPVVLLERALDKLHHAHPGLHATIQVEPRGVDQWHGHQVCSGRE